MMLVVEQAHLFLSRIRVQLDAGRDNESKGMDYVSRIGCFQLAWSCTESMQLVDNATVSDLWHL